MTRIRACAPLLRTVALGESLEHASEDERLGCFIELVEIASCQPCAKSAPGGAFLRWWSNAIAPWRRWVLGDHAQAAQAAAEYLIAGWPLAPEQVRGAILAALHPSLARLGSSPNSLTSKELRTALAEVAAWSQDQMLAPACAALLNERPEVAARAEAALVRLAAAHAEVCPRLIERVGDRGPATVPGASLPRCRGEPVGNPLDHGLAAGVESLSTHHRRGVALAAAVFLDTPRRVEWRRATAGKPGRSRLASALQRGPAYDALRAVLRTSSRPIIRLRAWEWLAEQVAGDGLLDRVRRAAVPIEHELVLARWPLALHPRRSLALRRHAAASRGKPTGLLPQAWVLSRLSVDARQGVAALAAADPARASEALEPALTDSDTLVRLATARSAPSRLLADLCFDPDARVVRAAALRLSRVGIRVPGQAEPPEHVARTLALLRRSPHGPTRGLALTEDRRRLGGGTGAEAGLALRRLLAGDPEGAMERLRRLMHEGAEDERVAAMLAGRRAGLAAALEPDLVRVLGSPVAPRLGATAATILADCDTISAIAALRTALDAQDARVRANALQSLGRIAARDRAGPALPVIGTLAAHPAPVADHRARANLLRAMIEAAPARDSVPCALNELAAMLTDHRSMHRLAGAWLAGRCLPGQGRARLADGFVELAARIERLAGDDSDTRVRARASACVSRLHAERRAQWASEPADASS